MVYVSLPSVTAPRSGVGSTLAERTTTSVRRATNAHPRRPSASARETGTRNFGDSQPPFVSLVQVLTVLSTVLLVVGAVLVGDAIHVGVVAGTAPVTSPAVVLRFVLGVVFLALGLRFRTPPEEYVTTPSDVESSRTTGDDDPDTGEFDPEVSPLGGDGLERVNAEEADRESDDADRK